MQDLGGGRVVRVVVRGRVQGVWFRDSCRRQAQTRGVAGWVRNRDDGRVEAVFAGSAADVDAMVAWMGEGPPMARVDGVEVHPAQRPPTDDFRIT